MKDDKLLEMIGKSAEDLEIPKSLQPEVIEEKIKNMEQAKSGSGASGNHHGKKRKIHLRANRAVAAAAALVLFSGLGIAAWKQDIQKNIPKEGWETVEAETLTESAQAESPVEEAPAEEYVPEESESAESAERTGKPGMKKNNGIEGYLVAAGSYDAVYEKLTEHYEEIEDAWNRDTGFWEVPAEEFAVSESEGSREEVFEAVDDAADMELLGEEEYSKTNVQVEGVDEGDIVKTDGKYIYVLRPGSGIKIVQAENLTLLSELEWEANAMQAEDMYLDGDSLVVIARTVDTELNEEDTGEKRAFFNSPSSLEIKESLGIYTYDIHDRKNPVQKGKVTQDGTYLTSRKNGDYVYLVTRYYPELEKGGDNPKDYIPRVGESMISQDCIYLPEKDSESGAYSYLVITSVDTRSPDKVKDSCAVVTDSYNYYVSKENIYVAGEYYGKAGGITTTVVRFSYRNGMMNPEAGGVVPGMLHDSFSMDEYQKYLRLVTSQYKSVLVNPKENLLVMTKGISAFDLSADGKKTGSITW